MNFETVKIKTESGIFIGQYPRHAELKSEIASKLEVYKDVQNRQTNVMATMTEWNIGSFEISNLKDYILGFLNLRYPFVSQKNQKFSFNQFWGNIYRKGDYAVNHDHLFNDFSIVYFLKSKQNDSPLIFSQSQTKIEPKEGRLIIFPSYVQHQVPAHTSNDTRITLSGNIEIIKL
jgi:hypothetical protein